MTVFVVAVALLAGCLEPGEACGDGFCNAGTVCDPVHTLCIYPEQRASCAALDEGTPCEVRGVQPGACHDGVCIAIACGDGRAEGDEECDGADLGDLSTCQELDGLFHEPRPLACRADCTFDRDQCGPRCGDDIVQTDFEQCDGGPGARSCADEAFYGGDLMCSADCTFDVSKCTGRCGDGRRTAGEVCDATDLGGRSCTDEGLYAGTLGCTADCSALDLSGCSGRCGDGERNGPEICDGGDIAVDCETFGWHAGQLSCGDDCLSVDTAACEQFCGDGVRNGDEECDGLDHNDDTCVARGAIAGALVCNASCELMEERCFWGNFRQMHVPLAGTITAGWSGGRGSAWIADDTQHFAHFDGAEWSVFAGGHTGTVESIWGDASAAVWAYTSEDELLHFDGTTWRVDHHLEPRSRVWAFARDDIWMVPGSAVGPTLAHFNGHGWTYVRVIDDITSVWRAGPDSVWLAEGDSVYEFTGSRWHARLYRSGLADLQILGRGPDVVWVVNFDVAFRYVGGKWREAQHFGDSERPSAWVGHDGRLFLVQRDYALGRAVSVHDGTYIRRAVALHDDAQPVWGSADGDVWFARDRQVWRLDALPWIETEIRMDVVDLHVGADGDLTTAAGSLGRYDYESDGWSGVYAAPLTSIYSEGLDTWLGNSKGLVHLHRWDDPRSYEIGGIDHIWAGSPEDVWAIGHTFGDVVVHFDGAKLTSRATPEVPRLYFAVGIGADVWGVGPSARSIVVYREAQWHPIITLPVAVDRLYGTGDDDVWAFLADGSARHFDGRTWTEVTVGFSGQYRAVWGSSPRDIWALSENGALTHYDGTTWSPVVLPRGRPGSDIDGSAANNILVASNEPYEGATFHLTHALPAPYGGACTTPLTAYCNASFTGHTRQATPVPTSCGRAQQTGGTVVYKLHAPIDGELIADVASPSGTVVLMGLGATGDGGCDPSECLAADGGGSSTASLQMTVSRGDVVYLAVAMNAAASPYRLDVTCVKR
jgi:hypothetical protein